jgi:hypothetical protein
MQYNLVFPVFTPPDFTIKNGRSMPVGAIVGDLQAVSSLGFSNAACNMALVNSFIFYNATTNIWDTFVLTPERINGLADDCKPDNDLPNHVDCYPTYLNKMFDPDDSMATSGDPFDGLSPLVPSGRASGMIILPGNMHVILEFMQFDPGQLLRMGTPSAWLNPLSQYGADWGYPSEAILEDPTVAEAVQSVSDFCTPLSSIPTMYGLTLNNPDTDLPEANYTRGINAEISTGVLLTGSHTYPTSSATYRDSDGDNIENQMDTCPLQANIDGNPRVTSGPDTDMIDSICDPSAMKNIACPGMADDLDDDNDGVNDVTDNCTCVANGPLGGPNNQTDADSDNTGDVCDPSVATIGQPGYLNPADIDNDGFLNAQDNCPLVKWNSIDELERWGAFPADGGAREDSIGSACDPNWNNDDQLIGIECTAAWNAAHPGVKCATCVAAGSPLPTYKQKCTVNPGPNPPASTQADWMLHYNIPDGPYYAATTQSMVCIGGTDVDGDGLCAGIDPNDNWKRDNCPLLANAAQTDADNDGLGAGTGCDPDDTTYVADQDGDTVPNLYQEDNCPRTANAKSNCDANGLSPDEQCDSDVDGIGDACDPSVYLIGGYLSDADSDGVMDIQDNCTHVANATQVDTDGDMTGDLCDPAAASPNRLDIDSDGKQNSDPPSIEAYWLKLTSSLYEANAAGGIFKVCGDGVDNDNDGSIDAADPGCVCPVADDADCDGVCDPGHFNALCAHEQLDAKYQMDVVAPPPPPGPIGGVWHETYPVFSQMWTLTSFEDNGNGYLDPSDQIDMTNMDTQEVVWFHVDLVTPPHPGEPIHIELTRKPLNPPNPISSVWHELYPVYSELWHLTSWTDSGPGNAGYLGPSDVIDMTELETEDVHWFHVDAVEYVGAAPGYATLIGLTLIDNCPTVANSTQTDRDNDGLGNACDTDDDGDTISDNNEADNVPGSYDTDWCDSLDATHPATNDPDADLIQTLADGKTNDGCVAVGTTSEASIGGACDNSVDDDSTGDVANDGCPQIGGFVDCDSNCDGDCVDAGEAVKCRNATDDDACDTAENGNRKINDGCPQVGPDSETLVAGCDNAVDDAGEIDLVNDGCAQAGIAIEGGVMCLNATDDDSEQSAGTNPCNADHDTDSKGVVYNNNSDRVELFIGTDPLDSCADTSAFNDETGVGVSPWGPDFNDSGYTDIGDLSALADHWTFMAKPYGVRYDLNGNGFCDIGDLVSLATYWPGTGKDKCKVGLP